MIQSFSELKRLIDSSLLPDEEKQKQLDNVARLVFDDILIESLARLPEEMRTEFEEEISFADNKQSAILSYFQRTIDGFDGILVLSLNRVVESIGLNKQFTYVG